MQNEAFTFEICCHAFQKVFAFVSACEANMKLLSRMKINKHSWQCQKAQYQFHLTSKLPFPLLFVIAFSNA